MQYRCSRINFLSSRSSPVYRAQTRQNINYRPNTTLSGALIRLGRNQYSSTPERSEKFDPDSQRTRRIQLEALGKSLGVKSLNDWYSVTVRQVENVGGSHLLAKHGRSLYCTLDALYPEHDWQPWLFRKLPKTWSRNLENQRKFLDWAATQLGFESLEGWYDVNREEYVKKCGRSVLSTLYKDSIRKMLLTVYPEHKWDSKRFKHLSNPLTSWRSRSIRTKTFELAMEKLSIPTVEKLADVRISDFIQATGAANLIYGRYKGSLMAALEDTYPDKKFRSDPQTTGGTPQSARRAYARADVDLQQRIYSLLKDPEKQRTWICDEALPKLGIDSVEKLLLKSISSKEFKALGAEAVALINRYGSLRVLVSTLYPLLAPSGSTLPLAKRKLSQTSVGLENFMKIASTALKIESPSHWYAVSSKQLEAVEGGKKILKLYDNSISNIVKAAYPNHLWDDWKFS